MVWKIWEKSIKMVTRSQANQMRQCLLPSKNKQVTAGPHNLILYAKSLEHFVLLDPIIMHLGIYPKEVTKSENKSYAPECLSHCY